MCYSITRRRRMDEPQRERNAPRPRRAARGRLTRAGFPAGRRGRQPGPALVWASRSQSKAQPTAPQQPSPGEYRAAWISYIELHGDGLYLGGRRSGASAAAMMDHCAALGAQYRHRAGCGPSGTRCTPAPCSPGATCAPGVQGQDPGFDPLDTLIAEAHSRGLSLEGWINPYRLRGSGQPARPAVPRQPGQHPPRMGGDGGRRRLSEPGHPRGGRLCGGRGGGTGVPLCGGWGTL